MFGVRVVRKGFVASLAFATTLRTPLLCQDPVWSPKGIGLPNFQSISPQLLETTVQTEIDSFKSNLKKIDENFATSSKQQPLEAVNVLEKVGMPLIKNWGLVKHLMGVQNSDDIRKVQSALQGKVVSAMQEIGQSKVIYDGLESIRANTTVWESKLDEAQRRIISSKIRSMTHSGVSLPKEQQLAFNALQLEAASLSTSFKNNVLDSTKRFSYVITDKNDMNGVPDGAKALFSSRAVDAGHTGSTAANGPWVITLDMPTYQACMQHVKNAKVREVVYKAYLSRASDITGASTAADGTPVSSVDNSKIIERLLQIRYETAKMLGYNNYAELSLSTKMAGSIDTVMDMISKLRAASVHAAQKDLVDVTTFAQKQCGFTGKQLELWDLAYYSERLREAKYGYKEEELKVYFALSNVLTGLFSLAEKLFGISIEKVPSSADASTDANVVQVWHKDVQFFTIKDSTSKKLIAAFYLDPYSRPENKNGGAWMDVCMQKSEQFKQIPVAYLICNSSPPVSSEVPALMTFREVETLFHEFGHGLQHMLTTVPYGEASGIANIEWDAVELPSQFMENWCYDTQTLNKFARHYQTNQPIPQEYIDKLKAAKNFQSGLQMLRQLYFGMLDMTLHSTVPSNKAGWVYDIQQQLAKDYTVIAPLSNDRFLNAFSHIFGGGYSAGYYSYKWAEVMSADAFGAFEEAGLNNEEAVKKLGKLFRNTVLSCGGGLHPSQVYKQFRGRDPTIDALLRHSGLSK